MGTLRKWKSQKSSLSPHQQLQCVLQALAWRVGPQSISLTRQASGDRSPTWRQEAREAGAAWQRRGVARGSWSPGPADASRGPNLAGCQEQGSVTAPALRAWVCGWTPWDRQLSGAAAPVSQDSITNKNQAADCAYPLFSATFHFLEPSWPPLCATVGWGLGATVLLSQTHLPAPVSSLGAARGFRFSAV